MRYVRAPALSFSYLVAALLTSPGCAGTPRKAAFDKYLSTGPGRQTIVYYDVHGRTYDELASDIRRIAPTVSDTSYVTETRSPLRWNLRHEITEGRCTINQVWVWMQAQITRPRWSPPPDADPAVVAEWKRFLSALETHESGHREIAGKAARDIITRLRGLTDQARGVTDLCSQLDMNATDIARQITNKAVEEEIAYDAETRHGLTQGATFLCPPRAQSSRFHTAFPRGNRLLAER